MALSYQRWTEEEDKKKNLLEDGEYSAIIDLVTEKLTAPGKLDKNGKPITQKKMLEIDLLVADSDGRERKIKDWVMLEGDMSWRFRHLCVACELIDDYENNSIDIDEIRSKVVCVLIKQRKGKDQYNNDVVRNTVVDYFKMANTDFNDDIKF